MRTFVHPFAAVFGGGLCACSIAHLLRRIRPGGSGRGRHRCDCEWRRHHVSHKCGSCPRHVRNCCARNSPVRTWKTRLQEVRKLALKDLIDRRLIIQAFKKESFQIPDHIVDQRVHDIIRESFGGDRNTFVKTLEAQNYSLGEFKEKEMERIIVSGDAQPQR